MATNNNSSSNFIERHLMPIAIKLSKFKPLIAIRDGIAIAMPLIIVGSAFMIAAVFQSKLGRIG